MKIQLLLAAAGLTLAACGSGGSGSDAATPDSLIENPAAAPGPSTPQGDVAANSCTRSAVAERSNSGLDSVQISGVISFDSVPLNANNGLDYDGTVIRPARGVRVDAVNNAGAVVATSIADEAGRYAVEVERNQPVTIRARAELFNDGDASWNVLVVDNTANGALYVLEAEITSPVNSDMVCDLHAASGWDEQRRNYTGVRAAAPFAITESIYNAIAANVAVDSNVTMPALVVNWSVNNTSAGNCSGGISSGCIGTSYYQDGQLYILGKADLDTDEYDAHVITHEWAHYFEHNLSRSDTLGGQHNGTAKLDMRVALGEGLANAQAGVFLDDPFYRDSSGSRQSTGFSIDIEANEDAGWFNEDTVQSIFYDIADSNNESGDMLAEGWQPIYAALTADSYKNGTATTSVFSLLTQLRSNRPDIANSIATMAGNRGVNGVDAYGAGESNDGGDSDTLPVYSVITNSGSTTVCSTDRFGTSNKLGVYQFIRFEAATPGVYRFSAKSSAGFSGDPDLSIYRGGDEIATLNSTSDENAAVTLDEAGSYSLEVIDFCNANPRSQLCANQTTGRRCIDVSIERS